MVGFTNSYAAIFIDTYFASGANFGQSNFAGETFFEEAYFAGPAEFGYSSFRSKAKFRRAVFDDVVNFREVTFLRQIDFKGTRFNGPLLIEDMYFTTLFVDGWAQFRKSVHLASDQRAVEKWILRPSRVSDIQAVSRLYIQLQEILRQNGLYADENDCYYELKELESAHYRQRIDWHPATWIAPAKYAILWATCGYGVRPQYTLTLGCVIVFLCTLVFYQSGAINERGVSASYAQKYLSRRQRLRDALYFSLNTFTMVGYGDWYPTDNRMTFLGIFPIVHYRTIAMLEGLAGWVLITVFVISLGKTWIR